MILQCALGDSTSSSSSRRSSSRSSTVGTIRLDVVDVVGGGYYNFGTYRRMNGKVSMECILLFWWKVLCRGRRHVVDFDWIVILWFPVLHGSKTNIA